MTLLSQSGLSSAGLGGKGLALPGAPGPPCPFLACPPAAPSPAAVLSLPTGVLEQLRSMVDDSEDTAPGLQPV